MNLCRFIFFLLVLRYKYTLVWLLFILIVSLFPFSLFLNTEEPQHFRHFDKLVHFFLYYLLSLFLLYEFCSSDKNQKTKFSQLFKLCCFGIIYGILMEVMQLISILERSFSVYDIIFDIIGSLTGLWSGMKIKKSNYCTHK